MTIKASPSSSSTITDHANITEFMFSLVLIDIDISAVDSRGQTMVVIPR